MSKDSSVLRMLNQLEILLRRQEQEKRWTEAWQPGVSAAGASPGAAPRSAPEEGVNAGQMADPTSEAVEHRPNKDPAMPDAIKRAMKGRRHEEAEELSSAEQAQDDRGPNWRYTQAEEGPSSEPRRFSVHQLLQPNAGSPSRKPEDPAPAAIRPSAGEAAVEEPAGEAAAEESGGEVAVEESSGEAVAEGSARAADAEKSAGEPPAEETADETCAEEPPADDSGDELPVLDADVVSAGGSVLTGFTEAALEDGPDGPSGVGVLGDEHSSSTLPFNIYKGIEPVVELMGGEQGTEDEQNPRATGGAHEAESNGGGGAPADQGATESTASEAPATSLATEGGKGESPLASAIRKSTQAAAANSAVEDNAAAATHPSPAAGQPESVGASLVGAGGEARAPAAESAPVPAADAETVHPTAAAPSSDSEASPTKTTPATPADQTTGKPDRETEAETHSPAPAVTDDQGGETPQVTTDAAGDSTVTGKPAAGAEAPSDSTAQEPPKGAAEEATAVATTAAEGLADDGIAQLATESAATEPNEEDPVDWPTPTDPDTGQDWVVEQPQERPVRRLTARLGRLLMDYNLISNKDLERALAEHRRTGQRLGHYLVEKGIVDEGDLVRVLAEQYGVPAADLDVDIPEDVLGLIPVEMARRYLVVPLAVEDGAISLAMVDPTDVVALSNIKFATGMRAHPLIATERAAENAIQRLYGEETGEEAGASSPREPEDCHVLIRSMILDRDRTLMNAENPHSLYELAARIDDLVEEIIRIARQQE